MSLPDHTVHVTTQIFIAGACATNLEIYDLIYS